VIYGSEQEKLKEESIKSKTDCKHGVLMHYILCYHCDITTMLLGVMALLSTVWEDVPQVLLDGTSNVAFCCTEWRLVVLELPMKSVRPAHRVDFTTYPFCLGCSNRRQRCMLAEPATVLPNGPAPSDRAQEKRNEGRYRKPRLACGKQAEHEELEEDDAPDQSRKCRRPCFTGAFIRIDKDCGEREPTSSRRAVRLP
jgi:hypothetical protein